ncbi:ABC transporter ATP-binding protein [Sulfolobales archaeon HS-7]|nr:ABC transporter ATP-binding protein [Sulfolobales archaeon HS-7]
MSLRQETDLSHDLRHNPEIVEVSNSLLVVRNSNSIIDKIPISDIQAVYVEEGIGIDKLIVKTKTGEEIELVYFTKSKTEDFRKFALSVEGIISSENKSINIISQKSNDRKSTIIWLMNFMKNYRKNIAIGVILSIFITLLNLIPPYLLKILIDSVLLSKSSNEGLFEELTFILISSYSALAVANVFQNFVLNTVGQRIVNDLRAKLFEHVIRQSSGFIDKISTGRIVSRLTSDVGNTQWLMVWGLPTLIVNFLTLIGIGVILFTMDVFLAIYVIIPAPLIAYLLVRYRRRSHKVYHKNWRRNSDVVSTFSDVIPNYLVVKSFAKEDFEKERFDDLVNRLYESQREVVTMNISYWPLIGFITSLATVAIWWIGGHQVLTGVIQIGVITAFISYLAQFYNPINNLSNVIPFIQQAITSGERIREILESENPIKDPENPKHVSFKSEIRFKDVWFGYDPFIPVIKGINLSIQPGQKIAFVGKSGSGKTTVAKLLLRLYDVNNGKITIGGVDLKEISLQDIRSKIGYVPQESVLFDNTVYYNISYGANRSIERWEIIAAALAARIHEEIMGLPLAYDTNLGERGNFLSGGQKQRISIARAILKQPEIVIFDEATSNLDVTNEREIYNAIMNLSRGRTAIFVTHNVHEVVNCDKVVVMKDGKIIEEGGPFELYEKKGAFYAMFKDQIELEGFKKIKEGKEESLFDYVKNYIIDKVSVKRADRPSRLIVSINGITYSDVIPRLPFPITDPEFVILYDKEGKMIGLLTSLDKVVDGREIMERAIRLNNLIVNVSKVKDIIITGDELKWNLETIEGDSINVTTKGRRNIMFVDSKLILIDTHDNLYKIELKKIDAKSKSVIQQVL